MKNKIKRIIGVELFVLIVCSMSIIYKIKVPESPFFPSVLTMIILYIIGALLLGFGMGYDKF